MRSKKKLSVVIALMLLLQLIFPASFIQQQATAATSGPIVVSVSPTDNTTNVPIRPVFKVTFDEDIVKRDLNKKISIHRYSDNSVFREFEMSSGYVTVTNNVLTLNASHITLDLDTEYYILIEAGAVANASNSALFAGINDPSTWNFKTITSSDNVRPILLSTNPNLCNASGTCNINVPITSSFTFIFNEPVYVASGSISLTSTTDNRTIPVTSSEITGSGSNTITITPSTALKPSSLYTLRLDGGNIVDASGNDYQGGSWRFNTQDSPVKVNSHSPVKGATGVNITSNLVLHFDQDVRASSTKKVQVRKVSDNTLVFNENANSSRITINGSTVTINAGTFTTNTSYYVTIESGAFYAASNANDIYYGLQNASDWRFTTGYGNDTNAPLIKTYLPAQNSTTVGAGEKIVLTFTEPVYVNSGNIEIREYNSNALYRSIDMTSSRITGGGTDTITIDPHSSGNGETSKTFTVGTRYYVTIGNQAFVDGSGNAFAGFSNKSVYTFQVSTEQTGPQLVSLSPVNLSTTVATDATFKLTFDKPVSLNSSNNRATIYSVSNQNPNVTAILTVSSSDNKVVELKPDPTISNNQLRSNAEYYVNIDGNSIHDQGGNYFVGIQNQYQWKFKTLGGDTAPPVITKSEVSGNVIRLVYNELLKEDKVPSPAQFYVTVAGNSRNVNNVKIDGNIVFITLSSSVSTSQQVLISYSRGSNNQIQDLTGNLAADFANQVATNGFTEANPVINSSSYNGSTITLSFTENLDTLHSLAFAQFSVTVNGRASTINRITQSNNNLIITLNSTVPSAATVVVSYSPGLYPLKGLSNNQVASFSHTVGSAGSGGNTNERPILQSATWRGNQVYLKYNKQLRSSSTPANYQYVVTINGRIASIQSVSLSSDTVTLTLQSGPTERDSVLVTYSSSSQTLIDNNNYAAPSYSNVQVYYADASTGGSNAVVRGAILKNDVLTINFSSTLDSSSIPNVSQFYVQLSNNSRIVSNVTISGSQVILKLNTPAKVGELAKISYFNTNNSLKSSAGTVIDGFSDLAVANQTSILDSLSPIYYDTSGDGVVIKTAASVINQDVSPGGFSTNSYSISGDRLNEVISTLADAQITDGSIVFEVPASERSAIVVVPVASLEYADRKGNYTIIIKHGNRTYELPVSAVDIKAAARALGGSSVSNGLKLIMEEGSTPKTTALVTAINRSGATMLEGPFYYEALIVNGSRSEDAVIKGNLTRKIQSSKTITNSSSAAVFYDEVVGQISYVPTTFDKSGSITTVVFKRPGNSAYAFVSSNKLYSDSSNHWGLSSISIMTRKFIADGHSANNFNPKTNITRGEFATYIVRGLGLTANKEAAQKFKDVNSNSVMGGYIGAAVESGIVAGVTSTSFAPNSYITRQDMAIMMIRAARYVGLDTKLVQSANQVLSGYSDRSSVSSYAKTGLAQAIQLGIISGTTTTTISPKSNAERVQGIIMIQRLLEKAGYLQK